MRLLLLLGLFTLILSCCDDDDGGIPEPLPSPVFNCEEVNCEPTEEFYGKCVMNQECWLANWTAVDKNSKRILAVFGGGVENGIAEELYMIIYRNSNLHDTIWVGSNSSSNPEPNIAAAFYSYSNIDASYGTFNFVFGSELSYEDYLVIDYFNADTSIIEGRFQLRFPKRSLGTSVPHAPDTMRLSCGSFRIM